MGYCLDRARDHNSPVRHDCDIIRAADAILAAHPETPIVFCDMHAEATSEKTAMGWYLNGRASAVVGTHTHVPTADARILPGGTAYVTDVGMVGPRDGCIGMDKDVVLQRFLSGQYDAVYFNATKSDLDPGTNPDFWFSSGSAHPWNVEQKTPATEWERQIDALMTKQIAARDEAERKRLYDEIQKIFYEHQPIVYFVAPRIYAASSARVLNVTPSDARPQLLWRPEAVAVVH